MAETLISPLHQTHEQAGAEFQPYAQLQIVSTFGEPQAEYAAIRKSAALVDAPQRGFIELSGKDRLPFLNNLLTNKTWDKEKKVGLQSGHGVYAFLLNTKGRIVADVTVLERGDRTLLEMDARMVEPVRAVLDKYIITEQVKLASQVGLLHSIELHGPGALSLLNSIAVPALPDLSPLSSAQTRLFEVETIVWRDDPAAVPGYHLAVPVEAARKVWMSLISRFGEASGIGKRALRPAGWAAFNATRIEGGRPIFGVDFDDSVLPAETGQLDRAVSFTKGCYLGQEIVARMHARQQLARQLVGIRMEGDELPIAGAPIFDDASNQIGAITSSTISPLLSNAAICLGFVKKPFTPPGSTVRVPAEGAIRKGTVVATPFLIAGEKAEGDHFD